MSRHYTAARRDANHAEIANALRRIGASVGETDGVGKNFPDLIAALRDTVLMEVKVKGGKFSIGQLRFLAEWRGYSAFVSSGEQAIQIIRSPQLFALSEKDKLKILRIVLEYEGKTTAKYPQISVATFDKKFGEVK